MAIFGNRRRDKEPSAYEQAFYSATSGLRDRLHSIGENTDKATISSIARTFGFAAGALGIIYLISAFIKLGLI